MNSTPGNKTLPVTSSHSLNGYIFLVTHLVPYPPTRGVELRILKLLQWLHEEGYRVILVIPADSLDGPALHELRKLTHAVYWTKPALRTRLGKRLPYLRKFIWEPLKPALRRMNQREAADQQPPSSVTND